MEPVNKMPISVRPPTDSRAKLARIASELRKSEAGVIVDLLTDALEMIETGRDFVPQIVRLTRLLREHDGSFNASPPEPAQRRDKREVAFYTDDSISAGRTSGTCTDNPPAKIKLPASVQTPVDFAVRVCGNSMEPMIHEGEVALFKQSETAPDGRIVAALVDGQMVLKLFKAANGGPAQLVSLNQSYPSIRCTPETRIQGIYEGKFTPKH